MKRPIEPADIKAGDLIRVEWSGSDDAHEFRRGATGGLAGYGTYYLLERPTPAVDLPTEPTLGWATWAENREPGPRLAVWSPERDGIKPDSTPIHTLIGKASKVTAFVPAIAVPKSALDALRRALEFGPYGAQEGATKFLAAVDAANGDAS